MTHSYWSDYPAPKGKESEKNAFFLGQGFEKVGLKMSSGLLLYSKAGRLLGFKLYFGIFESVFRIAYI